MKKEINGLLLLTTCSLIFLASCKKCDPPTDCDVVKNKTLTDILSADNSIVFSNRAGGSCALPAPVADSIYAYNPAGTVIQRRSLKYGPVATMDCNDYPAIGYTCFASRSNYSFNPAENVSTVSHQMEQSHFTITAISYDDKTNPLFDACNKNYFANFAYYPTEIGGTFHPGIAYASNTLFQFVPLSKNNPTYLKFEAEAEPGYDSHIIEITLKYEYCNGYPAVVHITQKNTDIEYLSETTPTVTTSDKGYFFFNYEAAAAK